MKARAYAYAAAVWAICFAAPHVYWTFDFTGIRTSLAGPAVENGSLTLHLACLAIAAFLLCAAVTALATLYPWPRRWVRPARKVLVGLCTFGAVLLTARTVAIWLEFSWHLTDPAGVPAGGRDTYLYLGRWFLLLWGPWFGLGAVLWSRLAWNYGKSFLARGRTRALDSFSTT
ncbi:MAG: DUF3995 domain-containing protein [Streptosporangiales bacterium]